jgi:tryptophan-specific transport protein
LPREQQARTSLVPGIAIVAGTAVGAGMFSLPIVSSGMWFNWSLVLLVFTWFCMCHSALMILEANLNFRPGTSFSTFVGDLLGPWWNVITGLSLVFVLYILTYAYVSGGGSIVNQTLASTGIALPQTLSGLLFALVLAFIVWFSTGLVGRVTAVLIAGMMISFGLSVSGLVLRVEVPVLLHSELAYAPFLLAAVPYFLTSFGFHGNIPSLMKYYGKSPPTIVKCVLIGSLLSLLAYSLWQLACMGNLSRADFKPIIAAGGNIGDLVGALDARTQSSNLNALLNAFANMAVVSSFLGVTLGLFDYLADRLGFDDSRLGRFKTACVTFAPPTLGGLLFPDGFLYAIGLAGLCASIWGTVVPALCARASRRKYGSPHFRVWGGDGLIYLVIGYGVLLVACYLLAALDILPVYR